MMPYRFLLLNLPLILSATPIQAYNVYRPRQTEDEAVKCIGLDSKKYITRDTLSDLIDNSYCPLWEGAKGEIGTGTYLQNSPENVEISVTGNIDADGAISVDDCKANLHKVLDGCDGDGSTNPINWKAGGEMTIGDWSYSLRPLHDRPTAPTRPLAWCILERCDSNVECTARMWGTGWLNSGFGHELRDAFDTKQRNITDPTASQQLDGHKGIDTSGWTENFEYDLSDDDTREWSASVQLNLGSSYNPESIIIDTMRVVANPKDSSNLVVDPCTVLIS